MIGARKVERVLPAVFVDAIGRRVVDLPLVGPSKLRRRQVNVLDASPYLAGLVGPAWPICGQTGRFEAAMIACDARNCAVQCIPSLILVRGQLNIVLLNVWSFI